MLPKEINQEQRWEVQKGPAEFEEGGSTAVQTRKDGGRWTASDCEAKRAGDRGEVMKTESAGAKAASVTQ